MFSINRAPVGAVLAAATLAFMLPAGSARATTHTSFLPDCGGGCGIFDFRAEDKWHQEESDSSFSFSSNGINITATATWTDGSQSGDAYRIGKYTPGLGAKNSTNDNSHTVDGYGRSDTIWLTSDQELDWSFLVFGYVGNDAVGSATNEVELFSDADTPVDAYDLDDDALPIIDFSTWSWYRLLPIDFTGTTLGINAPGPGDSWKVAGALVCKTPPPPVTAVPAPSAAGASLLSLAGIGMASLGRRRRRRTA